ncbi:hypothetical protein L1281_001739 [Neisseria sp. HSC-16F19]|nr:hypothetical protein [Neisseria sp. HSC-16F19]
MKQKNDTTFFLSVKKFTFQTNFGNQVQCFVGGLMHFDKGIYNA